MRMLFLMGLAALTSQTACAQDFQNRKFPLAMGSRTTSSPPTRNNILRPYTSLVGEKAFYKIPLDPLRATTIS